MTIATQLNKIIHYFKRPEKSAHLAKERLQIIIAHERIERDKPDYLANLQKDLLAVISKYVPIDQEDVRVDLERKEGCSILELNVTLPNKV